MNCLQNSLLSSYYLLELFFCKIDWLDLLVDWSMVFLCGNFKEENFSGNFLEKMVRMDINDFSVLIMLVLLFSFICLFIYYKYILD